MIKLLQWKGFIVTTNFSYTIFLVQFPILFYFAGTARVVQSYGIYSWIIVSFIQIVMTCYSLTTYFHQANFEETLMVVLAAVSLTLFIEMPVKNVCNLLLKSKKCKGKEY